MPQQHDPKTYRELSTPFTSIQEANAHWRSFQAELAELRKRFKIPNLVACASFSYLDETGDEAPEALSFCSFGDSLKQESMVAYTLGHLQAERQELIGRMLARGLKQGIRE